MKPGDVVHHIRSGQRLYVEGVEGRSAYVAWYDDEGTLCRGWFGTAWLVERGVALA